MRGPQHGARQDTRVFLTQDTADGLQSPGIQVITWKEFHEFKRTPRGRSTHSQKFTPQLDPP
jgi:hypothetical protein